MALLTQRMGCMTLWLDVGQWDLMKRVTVWPCPSRRVPLRDRVWRYLSGLVWPQLGGGKGSRRTQVSVLTRGPWQVLATKCTVLTTLSVQRFHHLLPGPLKLPPSNSQGPLRSPG